MRRITTEHETTVIMATHSMEAAKITDTVVEMRDGRVQAVRQLLPSK